MVKLLEATFLFLLENGMLHKLTTCDIGYVKRSTLTKDALPHVYHVTS